MRDRLGPMNVRFAWDPQKARDNLRKHGVGFEEALTVFRDPLARIHADPGHSQSETREILVGHSDRMRLLLVSFAARGETVRIISARKATRSERNDYEEGQRS